MNAVEAHERCVDIGGTLSKIEHNLYQVIKEFRRIEGYIEVAIEHSDVERSNVSDIITID